MSFTSGTQALQGRTVNHDPAPWVNVVGDSRSIFGPAWFPENEYNYDPRPEFAVLDNPILALFRKMARDQIVTTARHAGAFLASVNDMGAAMGLPTEQIDHARRVLTKLAAL